jgi:hypothetical protein
MTLGNIDFFEPPEVENPTDTPMPPVLPPTPADGPRGPPGSLELAPDRICAEALRTAAQLLGCGENALLSALNSRTISAGGDMCVICKKLSEARASRDALAKALYERLFDHVIHTLNGSLAAVNAAGVNTAGVNGGVNGDVNAAGGGIAVLDIFGCVQLSSLPPVFSLEQMPPPLEK